jgi:6-phosphogluconolactonase
MTRTVVNLTVVKDPEALAQVVAACVVDAARAAIAVDGGCALALAGGTTPRAAYALLTAPPLRDGLDWSKVSFFFGDERCVGPDDPQSNYKMAYDALLGPLGISPARIFRMRGEDEPAKAARDYADVLRGELGSEPRFDLMMLGMGPDGHTASLFPGADPFEDDAQLVRAPYVAKLSTFRITVTPRVINAAHLVFVATAGPEKAVALATALEGPRDPISCPIQVVAPARGRLVWLVDRAAAAGLRNPLVKGEEP